MSMFSPRFKSVAEKAGWDEEALLLASLVVQDTPDRNAQNKKRSNLLFKSPPTSRRKRRPRRRSPGSMSIAVFNLDDDDSANNNDKGNEKRVEYINLDSLKEVETDEGKAEKGATSTAGSTSTAFPCADRLREELSCAICLEICYEPSTTPCGHSFCKKCLKNAVDKCGKRCPKCRQLISNGRSCTVNTVLWNTIQLLFPVEVEARRATEGANSRETERQHSETTYKSDTNLRVTRRIRPAGSRREGVRVSRREERGRGVASQDEDAALALRLQREEFMTIYRGSSLARDNLREMAQRAINLRARHRAV